MTVDISASEVRTLADIGFAAVFMGLNEEPEPIFEMMTTCRPNNAAGFIGKAVQLIYRGRYERGVALLEEKGLSAEINSDQAKAVHLFALFCADELERVRQLAASYLDREPDSAACRTMALLMQEAANGKGDTPPASTTPRSSVRVPGLPVE